MLSTTSFFWYKFKYQIKSNLLKAEGPKWSLTLP